MIYYLDSQYGNDKNDGLSRQTAFRTLDKVNSLTLTGGDKLLIKAGTVYEGSLSPKRERGNGIIYINRYGVGEKPLINGIDTPPILLENFDEVELENIAVTNVNGDIGIHVVNTAGGAMKHVHIRNCHISHVNDDVHTYSHDAGGIICASWSEVEQGPGWFDDLLIEDNEIYDVCRSGILVTGFWANRYKEWAYNDYISDEEGWWPSYGVVVRGNRVERTGGDGIFIIGTVDALMEWNTVYYINHNIPAGTRACNAGIWPQASNNCVLQFNESAYANKPEGIGDSQGFDVDYTCQNTILQYNYSHDNGGGCLTQTELRANNDGTYGGTIFRNNLSVNDGTVRGEVFCLWGPIHRAIIENNTVIPAKNVDRLFETSEEAEGYPNDIIIKRNLFICNCVDNNSRLNESTNMHYEENLYWGEKGQPREWDKDAVCIDPQLINLDAPRDGMGVIMNYVPRNKDLILEGKPASSAEKDLLGNDTNEKAYIGAILPE